MNGKRILKSDIRATLVYASEKVHGFQSYSYHRPVTVTASGVGAAPVIGTLSQ